MVGPRRSTHDAAGEVVVIVDVEVVDATVARSARRRPWVAGPRADAGLRDGKRAANNNQEGMLTTCDCDQSFEPRIAITCLRCGYFAMRSKS